jgi:hypothetical protein
LQGRTKALSLGGFYQFYNGFACFSPEAKGLQLICFSLLKFLYVLFCRLPKVAHIRSNLNLFFMEQLQDDFLSSENELRIENETSGYLVETSKWAKFIAITFYILTGIVVLFFIVYGNYMSDTFGSADRYGSGSEYGTRYFAVMTIVLVLIVAVVGVTYYFLLSFANKMRAGIETENTDLVNNGLQSLKVHYIIIGILMMLGILLSLYNISKS